MIRKLMLAGVALFATTFIFAVVVDADQQPAHQHAAAVQAAPSAGKAYAMKPATGTLPPLPSVNFAPVEPMAQVREVYEFAARHPEVLQYIPCYCGCEAVGHKANHDCFVKSRSANGNITAWDTHGMGCSICLGVGREAMTMFQSGRMTVPQIRAAIDKKYGAHYPTHTPTPMPPAAPRRG